MFRNRFEAFESDTAFPNAMLMRCFDSATCFINNVPNNCLNEKCLTLALDLMTAHFCQLSVDSRREKEAAVVTSSSVGSVSVGAAAPPYGSSRWAWWLNTTSYGSQFIALLSGAVAGGFYIGGRCERAGFRKIGGGF